MTILLIMDNQEIFNYMATEEFGKNVDSGCSYGCLKDFIVFLILVFLLFLIFLFIPRWLGWE